MPTTQEQKQQNRERVRASRLRKIEAMGKEAYQAEEKVKRKKIVDSSQCSNNEGIENTRCY